MMQWVCLMNDMTCWAKTYCSRNPVFLAHTVDVECKASIDRNCFNMSTSNAKAAVVIEVSYKNEVCLLPLKCGSEAENESARDDKIRTCTEERRQNIQPTAKNRPQAHLRLLTPFFILICFCRASPLYIICQLPSWRARKEQRTPKRQRGTQRCVTPSMKIAPTVRR